MSTELIPLHHGTIGAENIQTVDARELHTFLEPKTRFNDWIARRIKAYGFQEGRDFVILKNEYEENQRLTDGIIYNADYHTVAEYVYFERLARQLPESAYKACSDHLRIYCMDNKIPFRKVLVGGKKWDDEYGFPISVWTEAFPGWLTRRYAQTDMHIVRAQGDAHGA